MKNNSLKSKITGKAHCGTDGVHRELLNTIVLVLGTRTLLLHVWAEMGRGEAFFLLKKKLKLC